jgi:hypothetical protein
MSDYPNPASTFLPEIGNDWRAQVAALPKFKHSDEVAKPRWRVAQVDGGYVDQVQNGGIPETFGLIVATHMDLVKRLDPNAQAQKAAEAASAAQAQAAAAQAAAAQAAAAAELTVAAKPLLDKLDAMESRLDKLDAMESRLDKLDAMESRLDKLDAMESRLKAIESKQGSCCVVS